MAIRINTNTPQQQSNDPSQYGAIRNYTSPLQGVQAADAGQGLQQAGQAMQMLGQHFVKKQDEVNRVRADKAVTNYTLKLDDAELQLKQALSSRDETRIEEAQTAYDALNPEAKDFSFNNYTDKPTDDRYYNQYINRARIGYQEKSHLLQRTGVELELIDNTEDAFKETERSLYAFKKDPVVDNSKFSTLIESIHKQAASLSDNFTDPRTKDFYKQKYSELVARAYDHMFSQATSVESLETLRDQFYTDLITTDGWGDFFDHEEQVDNAYLKRKKAFETGQGELQRRYATSNFQSGKNSASVAFNNFRGYDNQDEWLPALEEGVGYLSELVLDENGNPKDLSESDIKSFNSLISRSGLYMPKAAIIPEGVGPLKPEYQYSQLQKDAIDYAKTGALPTDLPVVLTPTDSSGYIRDVKALGERIKKARLYRDGGKVYKAIIGKDAPSFVVEQFMQEEFNETRRQITINQPSFKFPSNWNKNTGAAVNWMFEAFQTNGTEKMANWAAMSLESANEEELSDSKLGFVDAMVRAVEFNSIDTNDPIELYNFLNNNITNYARLVDSSLTAGYEAQELMKKVVSIASAQPDDFKPSWYKEVYENPNIRRSPATQKFYKQLFLGHISNIIDAEQDISGFLIGDEAAIYNFIVDTEKQIFSGILGNSAKSTNGRRIFLPDTLLPSEEQTAGKKIRPLWLQNVERFFVKNTMFKNAYRMGVFEGDPKYQEPMYMQSEMADALERGLVYEVFKEGVQYRMDPTFMDIDEDDPLNRHNTRYLVFKDYEDSELSPEELYLGILANADIRFERVAVGENGDWGYSVQRVIPGTKDKMPVVRANGEDLVISFSTAMKNAEVDLDTRYKFRTVSEVEIYGQKAYEYGLPFTQPRITNSSYFRKMQALEGSE